MNKSENIGALGAALAKAQGEIKGALKDSANPFFKSKYADLASVWDAIRAPFTKNGLAISQFILDGEHGVCVETLLIHESGEWLSSQFTMPVLKQDAQGVGSAVTYARRYALAAIAGVAPEDDDGNAATTAKPTFMPDEDVKKMLSEIRSSGTLPILTAAFATAYRAARSFGDDAAERAFVEAKDLRKKLITDADKQEQGKCLLPKAE